MSYILNEGMHFIHNSSENLYKGLLYDNLKKSKRGMSYQWKANHPPHNIHLEHGNIVHPNSSRESEASIRKIEMIISIPNP